jgi:hypothetical protein
MIMGRHRVSTALSLLLFCLCGCLHRKLSIAGNYTVEANADYPMLVPGFSSTRVEGDFQVANVILESAGPNRQAELSPGCVIEGNVFSLRRGVPGDSKHWTIRSFSVQGWNLRGGKVDTDEQWKVFLIALARMQQQSCFPEGMSVFSLQQAFAAAIPLPASEVQSFFYSANAEGYVDLAPGMEIKIEELLPSPEVTAQSAMRGRRQSLYAYYQVVAGAAPGVALRRSVSGHRGENQTAGKESNLYPHLAESFTTVPLMRLFFESLPAGGSKRNAMVLGASHLDALEAATKLVEAQGNQGCTGHAENFVCVTFKDDSVSLLSAIRVNEHLAFYPFGTQLAFILPEPSGDKQTQALETVRVMRRLGRGGYAEILFPRTMESARQVVLLPGDKVDWSH